jgi:hypothetical protein
MFSGKIKTCIINPSSPKIPHVLGIRPFKMARALHKFLTFSKKFWKTFANNKTSCSHLHFWGKFLVKGPVAKSLTKKNHK